MKYIAIKTALAASILGSTLVPFAAFADPAPKPHLTQASSASSYDGADQFRDMTGHPLPGWQYLSFTPNG